MAPEIEVHTQKNLPNACLDVLDSVFQQVN